MFGYNLETEILGEKCIQGISANTSHIQGLIERSLALATPLATKIGYDLAAEIAQDAFDSDRTIREVCTERGVLSIPELERILDPWGMTEAK